MAVLPFLSSLRGQTKMLAHEATVSEMEQHYFRDASNRLTHDRADIDSHSYSDVCRQVTDHFNLKPSSELVIGLDQIFWDFTNGILTVELA